MHQTFNNLFITFLYYTAGIFKKLQISDTLRANAAIQKSILSKSVCVHTVMRTSKQCGFYGV